MASPMMPPAGAADFLASSGWAGADIAPLAGDASFRRYFRVRAGDRRAVLMDAPPPHEDVRPFLRVGAHLLGLGLAAPRVLAADEGAGLALLEDFGDDRLAPVLVRRPELEMPLYGAAIDVLAQLHDAPAPGWAAPYDRDAYLREARLFTDWHMPALGREADREGFSAAWEAALAPILSQPHAVLTLRDYHADNLMLLDRAGPAPALGLLDFQDALAGHPAYDLVSLLEDARRDVSAELAAAMRARYAAATPHGGPDFDAAYAVLGAQRNTKIIGIFTRLWKRDGKPHYLAMQPRVWAHLEASLAHPALEPVRDWFDRHVPASARGAALAVPA